MSDQATAKKPSLSAVPGGKASPAPAPSGPVTRRLKKGELLFSEGENSRAMYLIKTGIIRLYKKKGDTYIELDTVHTGQVLGELAFLDGNPRSASGEALMDCELIEISGPTFQQVLVKLPDWLKILMKTIVGRLRAASTRIRQLESSSSAFDYSDDGKRSAHYIYLSATDCLKVCAATLLVGARNGSAINAEIRIGLLQRYANQIMGVPVAKITTMLDILSQAGIVVFGEGEDAGKITLKDPDFLEQAITYMNEENLLEPSKRHDISPKSFVIMSMITKHLSRYPVNPKTGLSTVNLAEVKALEANQGGQNKDPFRVEEFQELVKLGYGTNLNIKSQTEVFTAVNPESFAQACRLQRVVICISAANEQRRSSGHG
jgi:CRP/FNR family cyclic AMP-dependent transcriptional regulator